MANIESLFTHAIEDMGVRWDVSFTVRVQLEDGSRMWHYFGVTEAEMPRATLEPNVPALANAPFVEHPAVQWPREFNSVPVEMRDQIYGLSIPAGLNREGAW